MHIALSMVSLLLNHDNHQTFVDISHHNMLSQLYVKTHPRRDGNKVRSQVIKFNRQPGNPIFLQLQQCQYTISDVLAPYSAVHLRPFHGTYAVVQDYVPLTASPIILCTSQRHRTWCNKTVFPKHLADWLHHCRDRLHTHVISSFGALLESMPDFLNTLFYSCPLSFCSLFSTVLLSILPFCPFGLYTHQCHSATVFFLWVRDIRSVKLPEMLNQK